MPLIEEDGFVKLLKSETAGNIFFIFGEDDYLKDYYCEKLISQTVDENLKMFNLHIYQDKDTELETIFADADNLPMMSDKTCLLVRNYPLHELNKEALADFEQKLSDIPETTVLIFFYNTFEVSYNPKSSSKWKPVVEMFIKHGHAVRLDHRTPKKTAQMLIRKAKDRGAVIELNEALYLIDCVGDDMNTIINEFNKICAFSGAEKITKEMIDTIAVKSVEAVVYDINNAIFNGNADRAFEIANELLRQGTELPYILGTIASAYVNIYRYKLALNEDKGYSEFTDLFAYTDYAKSSLSKLSSFTKKTKLSVIRRSIDILAEADVRSKSSSVNKQILLTETISKLVSCIHAN